MCRTDRLWQLRLPRRRGLYPATHSRPVSHEPEAPLSWGGRRHALVPAHGTWTGVWGGGRRPGEPCARRPWLPDGSVFRPATPRGREQRPLPPSDAARGGREAGAVVDANVSRILLFLVSAVAEFVPGHVGSQVAVRSRRGKARPRWRGRPGAVGVPGPCRWPLRCLTATAPAGTGGQLPCESRAAPRDRGQPGRRTRRVRPCEALGWGWASCTDGT